VQNWPVKKLLLAPVRPGHARSDSASTRRRRASDPVSRAAHTVTVTDRRRLAGGGAPARDSEVTRFRIDSAVTVLRGT
jgi:hypothetical protein